MFADDEEFSDMFADDEEFSEEFMKLIKPIYKAMANDDEIWQLLAKMTKKMSDALIAEGFSPEQAGQIAGSTISSMGKSGK